MSPQDSENNNVVRETVTPYEAQDAWGNSIASLRANLRLTPLERLRKAEQLAQFVSKYQGVAIVAQRAEPA
jgi:hypothetical protein